MPNKSSILQNYMAQYGQALQSQLGNVPPQPAAAPQAMQQPMDDAPPDTSMLEEPPQQESGFGFRDLWKKGGDEIQQGQVAKLEKDLQSANSDIDSAYDELIQQMGTRPEDKKSLSKKEKAMLLMEFGIALMANSGRGSAGAAAGQAGAHAMRAKQNLMTGGGRAYDAARSEIEVERAKSKVDFASKSALERIKAGDGGRKDALKGTFEGDDGYMYMYDSLGNTKRMIDSESGKPIKADQKAGGAGGRGFESEYKFNQYLDIYGRDADGNMLTGEALALVKRKALEFANDRGKSIDDLDLDLEAEGSADDFIRSQADVFRGMTPDQINAYRNKIADERRSRLRSRSGRTPPPRSRLGEGEPRRGGRDRQSFNTEAEAQAAVDRGELRSGQEILIGGKRARVP